MHRHGPGPLREHDGQGSVAPLGPAGGRATPLLVPPPLIAGRRPPMLAHAAPGATPKFDLRHAERLLDLLREARVGGSFWSARPALPAGRILVRPREASDLRRVGERFDSAELLIAAPAGAAIGAQFGAALVLDAPIDPWHLIDHAELVIAHPDDPVALLGRAAGLPVEHIITGAPVAPDPEDAAALIHAALLRGWRYADPFDGRPTSVEATIATLGEWRRWLDTNRDIAVQLGMRRWKRARIDAFLAGPAGPPPHAARADTALTAARRNGGAVAFWPSRVPPGFEARARAAGVKLVRVEDGFLRSHGLGAALVPPQSIALDRQGMHYDPARPSDLEQLLETRDWTAAELERATALRGAIVTAELGKYGREGASLLLPRDRSVALVIGQVADDLSMRLGAPGLDNAALLAQARDAEPNAFLVYKPHPDVIAGHRAGAVDLHLAARHADLVLDHDCALAPLLAQAASVHVATSLAGFEALLRGVRVICHGQPFYAGWGLTQDHHPLPRRTRRLSLDALVAGALIAYPRYLDPVSGLPCPPELLVARLARGGPRPALLTRLRQAQGGAMRLIRRAAA
jgi:capsular polysaccharide export protein